MKVSRSSRRRRRGVYSLVVEIDPRREPDLMYQAASGRMYFIPAALEYGHAAPGAAGGPKVAQPIPFMRRAYDTRKELAARAVINELRAGLEREARKHVCMAT